MPSKKFHSQGKLLLFGEYAVLDGAKALAIPCRQGQSLQIKPHRGSDLIWECYDHNNELWFEAQISLYDFSSIRTSDQATSKFVQKLLKGAVRYNTEFLNKWNGFKAISRLEFPREWGLGSSSTIINNVANWAEVNPFHLHFYVSSGSGYDIACAEAESPVVYQLKEEELSFSEIDFDPSFTDKLYFLHLGNKQSSQVAISHYSKSVKKRKELAKKVTELTDLAIEAKSYLDFKTLVDAHEDLLSTEIGLEKVKDQRFSDFFGSIKSLGAWGGDFAMIVSDASRVEIETYFSAKGYDTLRAYDEMIYTPTNVNVTS